jgi:hypothetical protein
MARLALLAALLLLGAVAPHARFAAEARTLKAADDAVRTGENYVVVCVRSRSCGRCARHLTRSPLPTAPQQRGAVRLPTVAAKQRRVPLDHRIILPGTQRFLCASAEVASVDALAGVPGLLQLDTSQVVISKVAGKDGGTAVEFYVIFRIAAKADRFVDAFRSA